MPADVSTPRRRVLVTGATGFLGGAVAQALHSAGQPALGHGRSAQAARDLQREGIDVMLAPLEDRDAVARLFDDAAGEVGAVVHCAAKSAPFGPRAAFVRANVDGTRNLLEASARANVSRFVHISSPSIYCAGAALQAVREDAPLPKRPINHYAGSKREAEALVLAAHAAGLPSIILRPRAIYGPGDNALFPRLLTALRAGKLPTIGAGTNRIDLTFIDDAVQSVRLALTASDPCLGRAFNITSGEAAPLWELIATLCERLDLAPPSRHVPRGAARKVAAVAEAWHRLLRRKGEPALTRYSVDSLSLDATLDISAARRDLGYEPEVSVAEGVERFLSSLSGAGGLG